MQSLIERHPGGISFFAGFYTFLGGFVFLCVLLAGDTVPGIIGLSITPITLVLASRASREDTRQRDEAEALHLERTINTLTDQILVLWGEERAEKFRLACSFEPDVGSWRIHELYDIWQAPVCPDQVAR